MNKGKLKKLLALLIIQILISIPLYILASLIFGSVMNIWLVEKIIAAILFLIALHISLLILSKKFVQDDAKYLSTKLAVIYAGFYIASFIYYRDSDSLVIGAIYTLISFLYTRWYVGNKVRRFNYENYQKQN